MNHVNISLSSRYDYDPPTCKIVCCGEVLFNNKLLNDIDFTHSFQELDQFTLEIFKTGITIEKVKLNLVKKQEEQIVKIENLNLNGIDLKIKEYGMFHQSNNPYMDDEVLQTDTMTVNGVWQFKIPKFPMLGEFNHEDSTKNIRDSIEDCEVACFGCSQTYGAYLPSEESWPSKLKHLSGKEVKNFGINGTNIKDIMAFVEYYLENYKTNTIFLYLPHTMRNYSGREYELSWKKRIPIELTFSEHVIALISGKFYNWLEDISRSTKIYFGTYIPLEDDLYRKTPLKKYMFPFLDGDLYPKASDNLHHGANFNQNFAKMLKDFLDLYQKF